MSTCKYGFGPLSLHAPPFVEAALEATNGVQVPFDRERRVTTARSLGIRHSPINCNRKSPLSFYLEMKVALRPAPPPPVNYKFPQKPVSIWNESNIESRNKSTASIQKKKPPPRPPPPKFTNANKKSAPSRPSQLIADLFHRKNHTNSRADDVSISKSTGDASDSSVFMLIDFSSPPSSPILTTRSSSDALSVNSFGSDGVTQCSGSSGNASNVESGFEDDFDVFGATRKTDVQPRDPWSPPVSLTDSKNAGGRKSNSWVTFPSPVSSKKISQAVSSMPTIIRSKPDGHKAQQKDNNWIAGSGADLLKNSFQPPRLDNTKPVLNNSLFEDEENIWSCESPPMPTCPPPAPPPEVLNNLFQNIDNVECKPNGVALYDYFGEQPEDLSFKKDDVIYLVRKIDQNWYVGEKEGKEGSVPANFISIRVPLPDDWSRDLYVVALYSFRPETWDDLEFEEGSVIKVTHKIDKDWLYGECNGKSGQFPASFVDRVPSDLPLRRTE